MNSAAFPYPGSKTLLSAWILDYLPDHHTYVEPFGGSAAVLLNKEPSAVEIVNDLDGDIVHFYRTLRDRGDELREWVRLTPFSRELHEKYGRAYYDGHRPDDDIERAGRWFYLRNTQFAQKYTDYSGFRLSWEKNPSRQYHDKADRLDEVADRLRNVQIENLDYVDLVDRTDGPNTCFYFDPPYLDVDALYTGHEGFDHARFVDALGSIEGDWVVSYTALPEGLRDGYHIVEKEKRNRMRSGQGDWGKSDVERLVMNFDPNERAAFRAGDQAGLEVYADD